MEFSYKMYIRVEDREVAVDGRYFRIGYKFPYLKDILWLSATFAKNVANR